MRQKEKGREEEKSGNKTKKRKGSERKLGNLEILHLDRVQSSSFENMKKKFLLKKKEHLQCLTLSWNLEGDKKGDKDNLPLLESLKPHSELRSLILVGFQGPSLPVWLTSLKSLVKLSLKDCHGREFKYLSEQDDQLPNLKILELVNLNHLEYITEKCNKEAVFYKSLEEMTIKDCPKLKSWWEKETEVPSFAKLSKLHVHRCPLQTMPHYPSLDEEMVLRSCTLELLRLNTESIPLKNLRIQDCSDLTNLSGVFKHLSSLQCLTIENCHTDSLEGESKAWESLKSLRFLTLKGFSKLSSLSFGEGVTTLEELTLETCHKLTSISESMIGKLTSLQELTLRSCGGLTSISDSIGQVTSLRSLEISRCKKLKSLPKTIFKSLQTLRILNCDSLQPMFVKDTGDYFPLICHIKDPQVKTTLQG